MKDYDCEILFHQGIANVVDDTFIWKTTITPMKGICLRMIVITAVPKMIKKAQSEAIKEENQKNKRIVGEISTLDIASCGLLSLHGRFSVPYSGGTQQILMDEVDMSKFLIHPRTTKMYKDLKYNYWWHCMKRDVVWCIERCLNCWKVKGEHHIPHRKLQPLHIPMWKW